MPGNVSIERGQSVLKRYKMMEIGIKGRRIVIKLLSFTQK
jgi:hypothetical protein